MLACPNRWIEYETITGRTANWDEGYLSLQRRVQANGHDLELGYPFERGRWQIRKHEEQGSS